MIHLTDYNGVTFAIDKDALDYIIERAVHIAWTDGALNVDENWHRDACKEARNKLKQDIYDTITDKPNTKLFNWNNLKDKGHPIDNFNDLCKNADVNYANAEWQRINNA